MNTEWWEYLLAGLLILVVLYALAVLAWLLWWKLGWAGPGGAALAPFLCYGLGRFAYWLRGRWE